MKTTQTISKTLILGGLFFFVLSFQSSNVSAKLNRLELVRYKNSWIPKVELKEVNIVASSKKTKGVVLCQMVELNNKMTPFVQLNEITVTPSSSYFSKIKKSTPRNEFLVQNARINGKYMPHVVLDEITIYSAKIPSTNDNIAVMATPAEGEIIQMSVRKSFDRLANFLVIQGKTFLRKIIPSWFA